MANDSGNVRKRGKKAADEKSDDDANLKPSGDNNKKTQRRKKGMSTCRIIQFLVVGTLGMLFFLQLGLGWDVETTLMPWRSYSASPKYNRAVLDKDFWRNADLAEFVPAVEGGAVPPGILHAGHPKHKVESSHMYVLGRDFNLWTGSIDKANKSFAMKRVGKEVRPDTAFTTVKSAAGDVLLMCYDNQVVRYTPASETLEPLVVYLPEVTGHSEIERGHRTYSKVESEAHGTTYAKAVAGAIGMRPVGHCTAVRQCPKCSDIYFAESHHIWRLDPQTETIRPVYSSEDIIEDFVVRGAGAASDLHVLDRSQLLRVTLGPHTNARKAAKEQEVTLMADDLPGWPCAMAIGPNGFTWVLVRHLVYSVPDIKADVAFGQLTRKLGIQVSYVANGLVALWDDGVMFFSGYQPRGYGHDGTSFSFYGKQIVVVSPEEEQVVLVDVPPVLESIAQQARMAGNAPY